MKSEASAAPHAHPLTGDSGVKYNLSTLTAGKHSIEVVGYCGGAIVSRQQRNFRCKMNLTHAQCEINSPSRTCSLQLLSFFLYPAQSGLPSDPDNCQRMTVQNAVAEYDSTAETLSISFDTSTASTCVCKAPAIGQRKSRCE